jgi:hypothetical protein
MKAEVVCMACLFSLASSAWAIDPGPSSPQQKQTETWLQLQPSGQSATPTPQINTPAERDLSLQRWLNSYSHEIPDFYDQDKGGKVSSGSN